MKKILTQVEKDKKDTRNKIIIGIVLVGLMVLSTAGYALFSGEKTSTTIKKIEYKGIDFVFDNNGLWNFNSNEANFYTAFNPQDTSNITANIKMKLANYNNAPVYFEAGSDPRAIAEIQNNLGNFFSRTQYACLDNCTENYPVKNCSSNVISIKDSKETLIKQENNCVYILASSEEILKASDAFIFKILGI